MEEKQFIRGEKYSDEEYIELSISEMRKSMSEHLDRVDPQVGAVLVAADGTFFDKAHRGEFRKGDHAEYTLLERKNPGVDLTGFTMYTTLEPCVKRNPPKKGCTFRTINARIGRVVVGHLDPDPTVARNGVRLLEQQGIEVEYYSRKYEKIIASENEIFFNEATIRALEEKQKEIVSGIDPIENELLNFQLEDLSEEAQRIMIERMGLPFRFGTDGFNSFLNKMKLIKVDPDSKSARPTGLGLLLLGRSPQTEFPQARIKFTVHRGDESPVIKDFDGPLIQIPEKIEEYLEIIFPVGFSRSSFKRDERADVSYSAVLEVIMNAIVHRDYSIRSSRIMVDVDDEKIVISSPGVPLSPLARLNDFSAPSISRNPKIAYIFFEMGFVEERGFGLEELSKLEHEFGLPRPVFSIDGDLLVATIYRTQLTKVSPPERSSEYAGSKVLKAHKRLNSSQYAEVAHVSARTARRHLNDLVDAGVAERDGDGRLTEYVWIEE
jgi:ATP-dependent DNA helicase RecG